MQFMVSLGARLHPADLLRVWHQRLRPSLQQLIQRGQGISDQRPERSAVASLMIQFSRQLWNKPLRDSNDERVKDFVLCVGTNENKLNIPIRIFTGSRGKKVAFDVQFEVARIDAGNHIPVIFCEKVFHVVDAPYRSVGHNRKDRSKCSPFGACLQSVTPPRHTGPKSLSPPLGGACWFGFRMKNCPRY